MTAIQPDVLNWNITQSEHPSSSCTPTFIQNVQGSNLSQKTNYSDFYHSFPHYPLEKSGKVPQYPTATSFQIFSNSTHTDHPTIILQCTILTAS